MIAGLLGGVALNGLKNDLPRFFLGLFLRLFGDALNQRTGVVATFILDTMQQHFLGRLRRHSGDLQKLLPLVFDHLIELFFLGGEGFVTLGEASLEVIEISLFNGKRIELAIERVLALGEALLLLLHLPPLDFVLAVELLLEFDLFLAGGNFDFLGARLCFLGGEVAHAIRLGLGRYDDILRAGAEIEVDAGRADDQADDGPNCNREPKHVSPSRSCGENGTGKALRRVVSATRSSGINGRKSGRSRT